MYLHGELSNECQINETAGMQNNKNYQRGKQINKRKFKSFKLFKFELMFIRVSTDIKTALTAAARLTE
jgi:hypothetical protein